MIPFTSGIKLARESENMSWSLGVTNSQPYKETRPNTGSALSRAKSERTSNGGTAKERE